MSEQAQVQVLSLYIKTNWRPELHSRHFEASYALAPMHTWEYILQLLIVCLTLTLFLDLEPQYSWLFLCVVLTLKSMSLIIQALVNLCVHYVMPNFMSLITQCSLFVVSLLIIHCLTLICSFIV